jgi:hypothetical protein
VNVYGRVKCSSTLSSPLQQMKMSGQIYPQTATLPARKVLVPTEWGLCGPHKAVWTLVKRKLSPPPSNLITVSRPGIQSIASSLSHTHTHTHARERTHARSLARSLIYLLIHSHYQSIISVSMACFQHDLRPWDLSSRSRFFNIQYVVMKEREVDGWCPEH